jgi:diguanylate cyclase (GGDEF)-like protein
LLEEKNQELSQALDRLKQLFIRDDITGAYNRRYIFEQLERESTIFARHGHPVSIIMFDIDHFKKINDTFGHHTGDEVLRLTAQKLRSEIREIDLLARVGGEEFMILLPMQTHDVATSLAERLRVSLAAEPLLIDDQEISVTASFGCAQLLPEQDIPAWYKAADAAMYLAKKQGRNLVVNANTQGLAQR